MDEMWARISATSPEPDVSTVVLTGAAAVLVMLWWPTWTVARHVVTVVHEGAHAVVAVMCGRSLTGIRLHSDSSGLTVSRGRPRGPGMVATLFAGYVGPGVLGLAAAWVLGTGHAVGMLWALLAMLALLLLQIRNLYGLWVVLASGVVLVIVTWWGSAQLQGLFAYAVTWFLLLAAPRHVVGMQRERRRRRTRDSDPDQLARITWVPATAWGLLMLATTVATAALGIWLMLRR